MAAASINRLEVRFTPGAGRPERVVGTLAEHERRIYFEYADAWLAEKLELSPLTLPVRKGLVEHTAREFGPLPGLFDDSLPDGWGLLLMDRYFRGLGLDPAATSPLDRLAFLGTRTMGALTYHPPASAKATRASLDLHELSRQAREVHSGHASEVLPQLLRAGGSPGGARPKVLVGYDPSSGEMLSGEEDLPEPFEHWIVKFSTDAEGEGAGAIEHAYSLMAGEAGVQMPETRIFQTPEGDRFFGARRFDRLEKGARVHAHTFGNLIQTNFRIPSSDYTDLLKATSILTRDRRAVLTNFRLMVFNVFAHNRDDHVKNFSFLLNDATGEWSPSPAYDLTHANGPGGEHTMTVHGEGRRPTREHMLDVARKFGISEADADAVFEKVQQAVRKWRTLAEQAGVGSSASASIEARLNS